MFCISCGTELMNDATFCHGCGIRMMTGVSSEKAAESKGADTSSPSPNQDYGKMYRKYMTRGHMLLEDKAWEEAYDCFNEAYSESNNESAQAYFGRLCAEMNISSVDELFGTGTCESDGDHDLLVCQSEVKAGCMFLQANEWSTADEHFDRALRIDPECADAYLGKLLAETKFDDEEKLLFDWVSIEKCAKAGLAAPKLAESRNYQRALRFADEKLKAKLEGYSKAATELNEKITAYNENEKNAAIERELKEKKHQAQVAEWVEQGLCRYCGGELKGVVVVKCKACGEYNDGRGLFDRMSDKIDEFDEDRLEDWIAQKGEKFSDWLERKIDKD